MEPYEYGKIKCNKTTLHGYMSGKKEGLIRGTGKEMSHNSKHTQRPYGLYISLIHPRNYVPHQTIKISR